MKHVDKNEVDILLRGLAKRSQLALGVDQPISNDEPDHLDVDELSAYAEDALPSVTRARLTSHIADCASCRKFVSSLTLSAGTPALEVVAAPAGEKVWQKIAPWFSPSVLRYAAPALVLTALIAIGLIALHQSGGNARLVVQTSPTELSEPTRAQESGDVAGLVAAESQKSPAANASPRDAAREVVSVNRKESAQSNEVATSTPAKDQPAKTDTADAVQPTYAPEPPTAPASPPKAVQEKPSEAVRTTEAEQRIETGREKRERDAISPKGSVAGGISARKLESPPASRRAGVRADDSASEDKRKNTRDEDTRSVAGRRFRREGNSWIDTAYHSGASVVKVSRGSEQFRALVADEPGLKTVSDELSGLVIVVWKGRAYRIQ